MTELDLRANASTQGVKPFSKLSEVVSRATFGPQTSARELFSALCLDLSLPEVSNCFWEKSRGTKKYIIAGRDWCTNVVRPSRQW
ncbi:hypothetical protein G5I_10903 [Acromyrmex echinatior]|uniref:Uncharacterized protein n=1 Tax=Acromyrmex echinatior TaxID=103372 RepID=F4WYB9_ACREC|nr:hypothetical protein G5I_10903 [Acromyrmex echinatior]